MGDVGPDGVWGVPELDVGVPSGVRGAPMRLGGGGSPLEMWGAPRGMPPPDPMFLCQGGHRLSPLEMWGAPTWNPTFPPPLPPTTQAPLLSRELGKHLLEVEDLLQKHALLEADIAAQSERVRALNSAALRFTELEGNGGHHRGGGSPGLGGHWGWGVSR